MTQEIRPLVAGNWKMHGTSAMLGELQAMVEGYSAQLDDVTSMLVCFPATLIQRASIILAGSGIESGGQDCHPQPNGAHTGDIAAEMLKDAGASHVIVGHSERRSDHGETNELVAQKARAAWRAGLCAIICVGETEAERRQGKALDVLTTQLGGSVPDNATSTNTIIAYEPVWAIGTGLTPSAKDVAETHRHIRSELVKSLGSEAEKMRILYGGSVKPSNASELLTIENVDGALIGGASLKASDFLSIAEAYRKK